jgi:transposase
MRLLLTTHGGLLIVMMGCCVRTESLFHYFSLEEYVPADHLLRLIDRHVDFGFVRERLQGSYSHTGRPSIDPELLLRLLLVGYLYGITSERRLVDEVRMHLAYRWFTGLGFDQEVPHHSTFSKNRHGRFAESDIFRELFEEVVRRCLAAGLVEGKHLSVDGTQVAANASRGSRISREQLPAAAQASSAVREYLEALERDNPMASAEGDSQTEAACQMRGSSSGLPHKISATDPEAAWSSKRGPAEFAYYDNYLVDNWSCVILGAVATPARLSQEIVAAKQMVVEAQRLPVPVQSLGADKSYGTGEFLSWLSENGIAPHIPVLDRRHQTSGFYTQHRFTYVPEENAYRCPAGQLLRYAGRDASSQGHIYRAKPSQCAGCPQKASCTPSTHRKLTVSWHEEVRERVRALSGTSEFAASRRARNKVEALFSELRNNINLRRLRLRGLPHVKEQFLLAATAQNLKRLARFLSKQTPHRVLTTA